MEYSTCFATFSIHGNIYLLNYKKKEEMSVPLVYAKSMTVKGVPVELSNETHHWTTTFP